MRLLLTLPAVLLLAGCAATTEISTRFLDEEPAIENNRMLLVAQTPEPDIRDQWERTCADIFRDAGFEVTRSGRVMADPMEGTTEELIKLAGQRDTGLVLVGDLTRLLLMPEPVRDLPGAGERRDRERMEPTWTIELGPERERQKAEREAREEPPHLEARLMTGTGTPIWEAESVTEEAREGRAISRSHCRAILRELQEHGLVPGERVPRS